MERRDAQRGRVAHAFLQFAGVGVPSAGGAAAVGLGAGGAGAAGGSPFGNVSALQK
jgi:hypothetical protein